MRYPKPYKPDGRKFYYFRYTDPVTGERRMRSTHQERLRDAWGEVHEFIDRLAAPRSSLTFAEYAKPFFMWDTCPIVERLLDERKSIGRTHVEASRSKLDRWVIPDLEFSTLPISKISRGDILDFRKRLRARVKRASRRKDSRIQGEGLNTVNKTVASVKRVLSEAYFRGDIPANPGSLIGDIDYERDAPDAFTPEEIRTMFERREIWGDEIGYQVFRFAALTGMRAGEVLGMLSSQRDGNVLVVDHAWKHHRDKKPGTTKWGKARTITLCPEAVAILEARKPHRNGLVFCRRDGKRLGVTWWKKRFDIAMRRLELADDDRRLVPHSLRHSLNTNLLEAGVDPFRVRLYLWGMAPKEAQAMGTFSVGLTKVQRGYSHLGAKLTEPVASEIGIMYDLSDISHSLEREDRA